MATLLVDLSSIMHRHYHAHGEREGGDATSTSTVRFIRGMSESYDQTGVCCDSPLVPSFRHKLDSTYKAGRPPWSELLLSQYALAIRTLTLSPAGGGFPCFQVPGFEADDIIATLTAWLLGQGEEVVIASSDKDLLALVTDSVQVYSPATKSFQGRGYVAERYGVMPEQMLDYLSMVGDSSDNVTGIPGIGSVKAQKILRRWGSLACALETAGASTPKACNLQPHTHKVLLEGAPFAKHARSLLELRRDVPLTIPRAWSERALSA